MVVTHNREQTVVPISADAKVDAMFRCHGLADTRNSAAQATSDSYQYQKKAPTQSPPFDLRSFLGNCAFIADSCRPDISTVTSILARDELQQNVHIGTELSVVMMM